MLDTVLNILHTFHRIPTTNLQVTELTISLDFNSRGIFTITLFLLFKLKCYFSLTVYIQYYFVLVSGVEHRG